MHAFSSGLTVGDTLTRIDGERMVAYPLSDDGEFHARTASTALQPLRFASGSEHITGEHFKLRG